MTHAPALRPRRARPSATRFVPGDVRAARRDEARQHVILAGMALFFFAVCGPGDVDALHVNGLAKLFWGVADIGAALALVGGYRPLLRNLLASPLLLSWPALAILSSAWSLSSYTSLNHGLQLLLTLLAGYSLSALTSLRQIMLALLLGVGLAGVASLALIVLTPGAAIGDDGTWIGAFTHKNQLGGFMALELITATVLMIDGRHRWMAASTMPLAFVLMVGSHSGTALLALAASLTPLPLAWAFRRGGVTVGLLAGFGLLGLAAALFVVGSGLPVVDMVLGNLGKDSTLTGRTVLWQFGVDQIARTPVLGLGYKAYWEGAGTSAGYLRYVIGQQLWFFHNNFIDVGVAFGAVGLMVFVAGLLFAYGRTITLFLRQPDAPQLWRLMFMVFVSVEATAENPLFQNHSVLQLLMAVAVTPPVAQAVSCVVAPLRVVGQPRRHA